MSLQGYTTLKSVLSSGILLSCLLDDGKEIV